MKISKICCIGGLCESFVFADIFQKRIYSPTDGLSSRNFRSLLNIFDNSLFNDILNDNILKIEQNYYRQLYKSDKHFLKTHDDFKLRYYCINNDDWSWRSGHFNFKLLSRKREFKRRIKIFNDFKEDVKINKEYFYAYAISEYEDSLTIQDFEYTIYNLPNYVIDNLIIIGGRRNPIPDIFNKNFRCITYNIDLEDKENTITKLWIN